MVTEKEITVSTMTSSSRLAPVYREALKTWRPVILYFANEHCPACEFAGPIFRQIAKPYRQRCLRRLTNRFRKPAPTGVI
jgi:thioredoxin 1